MALGLLSDGGMKKTTKNRALVLDRTTIRSLSLVELDRAGGGVQTLTPKLATLVTVACPSNACEP
jgi:hypothetical protein